MPGRVIHVSAFIEVRRDNIVDVLRFVGSGADPEATERQGWVKMPIGSMHASAWIGETIVRDSNNQLYVVQIK